MWQLLLCSVEDVVWPVGAFVLALGCTTWSVVNTDRSQGGHHAGPWSQPKPGETQGPACGTTEPQGDPPGHWLWLISGVVLGIAARCPCCEGGQKITAKECPVLMTFALKIFRIPQRTVTGLVRLQHDAICLLSQLSSVTHFWLAELGMGKMCLHHRAPPG